MRPLHDLENKKNTLYDYFIERLRENPDEKVMLKDEYFTDEDDIPSKIDQYFRNVINRSNVQIELLNEQQAPKGTKDKATNTEEPEEPV